MASEKKPINSGSGFSAIVEKAEQKDQGRQEQNKATAKKVRVNAVKPSSHKADNSYGRTMGATKPEAILEQTNPEDVRSIGWFIFLCLITAGIYLLYWIYITTETANADKSEPVQSPAIQLLLVMFVPFYVVYWFWKTAKRVSHIGEKVGNGTDNSLPALLLSAFGLGLISAVILQDQLNKIIIAENGITPQKKAEQSNRSKPNFNIDFSNKKVRGACLAAACVLLLMIVVALIPNGSYEDEVETTMVTSVQEITTGNNLLTTTQVVIEESTIAPAPPTTSPATTVSNYTLTPEGTVSRLSDGRWALVNNGTINQNFTGVASNQNGSWYIENGYVNFNFSGKVVFNDVTYDVENGRII